MARYILLEVDDNKDADAIHRSVEQGTLFFSRNKDDGTGEYGYAQGVRVRGVFAKPTTFCECPNPGDKSSRGKKWGWWIHVECGKPEKGQWQHPRNLLEPSDMKVLHRYLYLGIIEPEPPPGTELGPFKSRHR